MFTLGYVGWEMYTGGNAFEFYMRTDRREE